MEFSKQKSWSGLPCPLPGEHPNSGIEAKSSALQADSLPSEPPGKPMDDGSVQFSSVAQLCPTLCNPLNRSTPGLPVHHQLLESTETHIHRVSDAIQPSHPLSSPSPLAPSIVKSEVNGSGSIMYVKEGVKNWEQYFNLLQGLGIT